MSKKQLNSTLADIEATLVKTVPETVRKLNVSERVYCVFLCYWDLSIAEDFTPQVLVGLERIRTKVLAEKGEDPFQYLWFHQELDNFEELPRATCEGEGLREKCDACFEHFSEVLGDETPGDEDEEGELLLPFRSAIQRAALKLNRHDWKSILDVTDDFVVVPTDSVGYWTHLDMEAGVPPERLALLRERKLLWEPIESDD